MTGIFQEIREKARNGVIPYDTYIELALYHNKYGYYQKNVGRLGKEGDFYTANHVGGIFSELMARIFFKAARQLNLPLQIMELGGGDGRFFMQLMDAFKKMGLKPDKYIFVEHNPYVRKQMEKNFPADVNVDVYESLEHYMKQEDRFTGFVFSNEFLDAQPVRVVVNRGEELKEVMVAVNDKGELTEIEKPCATNLMNWLSKWFPPLMNDQRTEVPVYMDNITSLIDQSLIKGLIFTFDYGYTNKERLHYYRRKGSLRGYMRHRMVYNPLQYPGDMDITHHVPWDTWIKKGQERHWKHHLLTRQNQFFGQIGELNHLFAEVKPEDPFSKAARRNRAIRTLLSDDWMGSMFDVCIQSKNMGAKVVDHFLNIQEK
ncbi:SAM-dependent methyltransferase [Virgibacillus sp. MSP4-1]|uniref:SAM-dependent methyltransferase n=1 Tax=Virgibacillus sp. MSP4-1 TaxID=2700081 RepID=UPI0003A11513|nr:SAM-dependent methyltransferase [Virgibacillus sp. MSP4-1]QHS22752.1 SAM-dependent methyltransferase [Virgibacillus sp. MSP4-1]